MHGEPELGNRKTLGTAFEHFEQNQGRYLIDLTQVLGKLVQLEQAQGCAVSRTYPGYGGSVCSPARMIFSLDYQCSTQCLNCPGHWNR